jgi:hypothetical protein
MLIVMLSVRRKTGARADGSDACCCGGDDMGTARPWFAKVVMSTRSSDRRKISITLKATGGG